MSSLNASSQTHQQVLLQPAALEDVVADKQQGTYETDHIPTSHDVEAGVQHGRGEIAEPPVRGRRRHPEPVSAGDGLGREPQQPQPRVFVLSRDGQPLDPTSPRRARLLLNRGRAVVVNRAPFVIRLRDRHSRDSHTQGVHIGVDPGSRTTGIAVWTESEPGVREAVFLAEVDHRSQQIKKRMEQRSNYRRRRRSANLRYRAPRFDNRVRPKGWLSPSLQHRVDTTASWVAKLSHWAPVKTTTQELVRFDTQLMQNPSVSGIEYQQGELSGYEVREFLLEKWGRRCAYCDATNVPLQVDHILAKARGGSDRVSNLTLACQRCNQEKGSQLIEDYLAHDPSRLARINRLRKQPLRDAAAVNATRWALWHALEQPHVGTGGQTKYNRSRFNMAKSHALDALAVGHPSRIVSVTGVGLPVLRITCTGRGQYQRTRPDKYGFPRLRLTRRKQHYGFQTGDHVHAHVPSGKKQGVFVGKVAVRSNGYFNITTGVGTIQGINHQRCRLLQRGNGYAYTHVTPAPAIPPGPEGPGILAGSR